MITCPSCRHQEYDGELFCAECGARLWNIPAAISPTLNLNSEQLRSATLAGSQARPTTTPMLLQIGEVALSFGPDTRPLILRGKMEYVLGRETQEAPAPDAILTPYGAREKGVSRRHARLRLDRHQLLFMDLNSSNGSFLNGVRLTANESVRLENGDEVRLGKLALRVHFNL